MKGRRPEIHGGLGSPREERGRRRRTPKLRQALLARYHQGAWAEAAFAARRHLGLSTFRVVSSTTSCSPADGRVRRIRSERGQARLEIQSPLSLNPLCPVHAAKRTPEMKKVSRGRVMKLIRPMQFPGQLNELAAAPGMTLTDGELSPLGVAGFPGPRSSGTASGRPENKSLNGEARGDGQRNGNTQPARVSGVLCRSAEK